MCADDWYIIRHLIITYIYKYSIWPKPCHLGGTPKDIEPPPHSSPILHAFQSSATPSAQSSTACRRPSSVFQVSGSEITSGCWRGCETLCAVGKNCGWKMWMKIVATSDNVHCPTPRQSKNCMVSYRTRATCSKNSGLEGLRRVLGTIHTRPIWMSNTWGLEPSSNWSVGTWDWNVPGVHR